MKVNMFINEVPTDSLWISASGLQEPKKIITVDDQLPADIALQHASNGFSMLWEGDYHQAKMLMSALGRRFQNKDKQHVKAIAAAIESKDPKAIAEQFHLQRMRHAQKANAFNKIILPMNHQYEIIAKRAPDIQAAFRHAWGNKPPKIAEGKQALISLRELMGMISAYEWHQRGLFVEELQDHLTPSYGVFSPVRSEYLYLMTQQALPASAKMVFDIGTGTGILSIQMAALCQESHPKLNIIATDNNPRAVSCANFNVRKFGLDKRVKVQQTEMWPEPAQKADVIICNPPWLPGKATSVLESAIYDPKSQMLKALLSNAYQHLTEKGQLWLIMSDLAEYLGLRAENELAELFAQHGWQVEQQHITSPVHPKVVDKTDPFVALRAQEKTSLWVLTQLK